MAREGQQYLLYQKMVGKNIFEAAMIIYDKIMKEIVF